MKDQSTPRPWRISQPASITMPRNKNIISGIGDSGGWSALADTCNNGPDHNSEANALLIVKAVNCHDELVEELKSLINNYRGQLSAFGEEIRDVVGNTNIAVAEHHLKLAEQALEKAGAL